MNNNFIPVSETTHELKRSQFQYPTKTEPLMLKTTNEEEKYIYLINKLKVHKKFVSHSLISH